MSCSQASRISKRITQIILLMHFLIKQKCKTILIASALQSKLYWSATTSSSSLIFNSASFPKYSRSIIHSQFIPALCISCIQEVLWVAWAEPRGHSTCWVLSARLMLPTSHPSFVRSLCHVWHLYCTQLIGDTWSPQATKSNTGGHGAGEGLEHYVLAEDISDGDTSHYLTHRYGLGLWVFPVLMTSGPLHHPPWVVCQLGKNNAVLEHEIFDRCWYFPCSHV